MKPLHSLTVDDTIVLFEPYFKSASGHNGRYARVLGQQAQRRGLTLVIAANADLPAELGQSLYEEGAVVLPVFSPGSYFLEPTEDKQRSHAVALANQALAVLGRIPTRRSAWLSGIPSFVEAAVLCASRHKTPTVFQMIDFGRDWPAAPLAAPERVRHALQSGTAHGLRFFAQGSFICDQLLSETGTQFRPFKPILDFKAPARRSTTAKLTAGTLNLGYNFKDVSTLLPLIEATQQSVHWLLHFGNYVDDSLAPLLKKLEVLGVEVLRGSLGIADYNAVWNRLDVTILPYDVAQYRRQGSGMFFEALSDGVIPVVPKGTSMAQILHDGGPGMVYDPAQPDSLASAFNSIASAITKHRAAAAAFAGTWRKENAPRAVFDDLEAVWAQRLPNNT